MAIFARRALALVGRPGLFCSGFSSPFALARAALLLEGLVLGLHDALFLGLFSPVSRIGVGAGTTAGCAVSWMGSRPFTLVWVTT